MNDPITGLSPHESDRLVADLIRDEGWCESPYECPAKRLTVGYGTLLPFTPREESYLTRRRAIWPRPGQTLEAWDESRHEVFPLTFEEGRWLLRQRAGVRVDGISKLLRTQAITWDTLPTDLRVALANMSYQLGSAGVMRFRRMVRAVKVGDYAEAAKEALDSKWAKKDTPRRAKRVAALIRGAA